MAKYKIYGTVVMRVEGVIDVDRSYEMRKLIREMEKRPELSKSYTEESLRTECYIDQIKEQKEDK